MALSERSPINTSLRGLVAFGIVSGCFFLIILRLWYLQIVRGDYFRVQSENNRIRTVFVPPPRGLILDRNGEIIVKNRPSFNIELVTEDSPDPKATVKQLAEITNLSFEDLWERVQNQRKRRRFEPKLILKDISRDLVAKVSAKRYELPGVIVNVVPARDYIYGDLAAHVLGYIREITGAQLERPSYAGYQMGDVVGQYGVEARWEKFLQGKRGMQAVVVDASGTRIGEASFEPEVAGHNLTLTIDLALQRAAETAMAGKKGAVVAMDANTGEILAMLSHPAFDPNMFAGEVSPEDWKDLTSGTEKKLNNRAVQGAYPPGSVFKVFMSAAALSEKIFSTKTTVTCPGFLPFGGRLFRCHKKEGHGTVAIHDALIMSCDVFYYTVGIRLGIDRIADYAKRFGLGEATGLELVDESTGVIPSTVWKKAHFKNPANQKWFPGETLSVAIGQGAVTTTPLQIARGTAAMVNGGNVLRPYLVKQIESSDGQFKDEGFEPLVLRNADVTPDVLETVKSAMLGVVNDPRGTGKRASLTKEFGINVGGKTGTAQVVALESHNNKQNGDHAWFTGYAPAEKPEIVVTALVENGGHGGVTAAPVVKEVMEAYFGKTHPRLDVEEKKGDVTPKPAEGSLAD